MENLGNLHFGEFLTPTKCLFTIVITSLWNKFANEGHRVKKTAAVSTLMFRAQPNSKIIETEKELLYFGGENGKKSDKKFNKKKTTMDEHSLSSFCWWKKSAVQYSA